MEAKTNSELTLNDVLYGVDSEFIRAYKIATIREGLKVEAKDYRGYKYAYEGAPNECVLARECASDMPKYLYSNLETAQSKQLELRRKVLETEKKNMLAAQEKYFSLVEKYKGTVYDKEIHNTF